MPLTVPIKIALLQGQNMKRKQPLHPILFDIFEVSDSQKSRELLQGRMIFCLLNMRS